MAEPTIQDVLDKLDTVLEKIQNNKEKIKDIKDAIEDIIIPAITSIKLKTDLTGHSEVVRPGEVPPLP